MTVDAMHDATMKSWVESAEDPGTHFPIQNLPWCVAELEHTDHVCLAIGDRLLSLRRLVKAHRDEMAGPGWLDGIDEAGLGALESPRLNQIASTGIGPSVRGLVQRLLREGGSTIKNREDFAERFMVPMVGARFKLPFDVGDYTDFYASKYHATNVGSMFRPDNPLLPNYVHIPVGYHGRSSSVVISGTPVHRPHGQMAPPDDKPGAMPGFGPCRLFDYELEMGVWIGRGNELGTPIPIGTAGRHIFGMCLLNDWSARDIQKWEYQPLGPFLAKNFATSVSPFVVAIEALEPFRVPGPHRDAGDPEPLEHLRSQGNWGLAIELEVLLQTRTMRAKGEAPAPISKGSFADMFWTIDQMLTHHASNGCNLRPGDLLGSGTVSGPMRHSRGCLLELTWRGDPFAVPPVKAPGSDRTPVRLPNGEERVFLQDGDSVILRGLCRRDGYRPIGFGECEGTVIG